MMFSVRESIIVFTESQIKYDIPKYLADTYIVSQVLKPPSFFLPSSPWSKKKKKNQCTLYILLNTAWSLLVKNSITCYLPIPTTITFP